MNRAERRAAERAARKGTALHAPQPPVPETHVRVLAVHGIVVNVALLSNGQANCGVAAVYGPLVPQQVVEALQAAAAGLAQAAGSAKLVAPNGLPIVS